MKRILSYLVLLLTSCQYLNAQKIPDLGVQTIRINAQEQTIVAELKIVDDQPKPVNTRTYYWYGSNQINATQGGFSGKLLNGRYTEFYLNKNLKQQGTYINGLKAGSWKSWDSQGNLMEEVNWNDGVLSGPFKKYNEKGSLSVKGGYRKGLLDGIFKEYSGNDSVKLTRYKNGRPYIPAPSLLARLYPFKKRKKDTSSKAKLPQVDK